MSVVDKKRKLLTKIAAVKAIANTKKNKVSSSYSSVNNKLKSSDFLIDLTSALVGAKKLKDYIIDIIAYRLPEIEESVKEGLKLELKKITSCNINPSIPLWLRKGGDGIQIPVTDVDFFDVMKVNPNSFEGTLIYTDTANGINSQDFNTYLYYTIQQGGTPTQWGNSVIGIDILEAEFIPNSTSGGPNNIIKYTTSSDYSNKSLSKFNNDFIDSLTLFGNPNSNSSSKIIALIMEEIFGTISSITNKCKKQLVSETGFKKLIDNVLEAEPPKINDKAFEFGKSALSKGESILDKTDSALAKTDSTLSEIDIEASDKQKGVKELETNVMGKVSVGAGFVSESMTNIESATSKLEEVSAIKNSLDNAAENQMSSLKNIDIPGSQGVNGISLADEETVKTNFFIEIVKKLQRVVMSSVMTPEFVTIFAINHQIIHGQGATYDSPIDFIKKNQKLVRSIGKLILNILLKLLLDLVIKELTRLLKQKLIGDKIEKAKNRVSIMLSYAGVPRKIIAALREVSK